MDIPSLQWGIPRPGPRMLFLAQCLMRDGDPETEGDGKSDFITDNPIFLYFWHFPCQKLQNYDIH